MKISNSYLEDEVREGFFVPSIMKRAWAIELEILQEIDKLCQRHGISWFAEWGTLLGAVRHKGFIPWDDDIDIVMMRNDYEHFLRVSHELPEGYKVLNIRNHPDYWYFLAKVVAKPRICFEEEHLEKYYGFPYIVGIDVYVKDYMYAEKQKEEDRITLAKYILKVADSIDTPQMPYDSLLDHLKRIEKMFHCKIEPGQNEDSLKVQLYLLVERLFSIVKEEESLLVTQMMPHGMEMQERRRIPKEWYEKSIRVPFEGLTVPIPVAYKQILEKEYGDYMCPVQQGHSHMYPYFNTQRKKLEEVLGFEIPGYHFSREIAKRQRADKSGSLKKRVFAIYEELEKSASQIKDRLMTGDGRGVADMLIYSQQRAIDLGTLIDNVKGEGLVTVSLLEEYCEALYQIYNLLNEIGLNKRIEEMCLMLEKIRESLYQEIIDRKEIVFLVYKAKHWDRMEELYNKIMAEHDWDVFVINPPYYDKNYLGEFTQIHDEAERLAEKIHVTSYDTFNFELHHPDCIVIQNPYDEYNMATSVDTYCYSKNLQLFTENLVYIPYFILDEFSKEDAAYCVMQYYCCMPGVVNADEVFVQSENMRSLYIEKLTEFAGEETRKIWEKKIYGVEDILKYNIKGD